MPDLAPTPKKRIIVIGAGIQGLPTAIAFQQRGYDVTIVESENAAGLGGSQRPDFNPYGIMHSGAFFQNNLRATVCKMLYDMLKHPEDYGEVMQIFLKHFIPTTKLLVARDNPLDLANLEVLKKTLEQRGVPHQRIEDGQAIDDLGEKWIANSQDTAAVVLIPEVGILHIANYIEELERTFRANGGDHNLKYSHEVVDFEVPTLETKTRGTGVIVERLEGETKIRETLYADAVINCAGLNSNEIAEKAKKALEQSTVAEAEAPPIPEIILSNLAVLVWKGDKSKRPRAGRVSYMAGNAVFVDPGSTVGAHVYPSEPTGDGDFYITIGPFPVNEIDGKLDLTITDDMVQKARVVYPAFDRADWELKLAGRNIRVHGPDGQRDMIITHCVDEKTGFCLWNRHTPDTPGATANLPLAFQSVEDAGAYFARLEEAPLPAAGASSPASARGGPALG